MEEEWREVIEKGFTLHVSNLGKVKNHLGREMSQCVARNGYKEVAVQISGIRKKFSVHRLVGKAFCEGHFEGASIDHVNGNKHDNRPENLEWVTLSENTKRQWRAGLASLRGEDHPTSVLTEKQVRCIRKLLREGVNRNSIAVIANVDYKTIDKIYKRATWNSLQDEENE